MSIFDSLFGHKKEEQKEMENILKRLGLRYVMVPSAEIFQ